MAHIFSIKPEFSSKIFEGSKSVELRRRISKHVAAGTIMLIYETSPTKAVAGIALIKEISSLPLNDLWRVAAQKGGITKSLFDQYFAGVESGYAIEICQATRFQRPIDLSSLTQEHGLTAPQSFLTVSDRVAISLIGHGQVSLGHQYPDPYRGCSRDSPGLRRTAA